MKKSVASRFHDQSPQQGQRKIITLNKDVTLNKAENAWKPRRCAAGVKDPETLKTEETLRTLQMILNKLTPEKFERLVNQVSELSFDTEERMMGAIDVIFKKAVSEQHYSECYAKMCLHLMNLNRTSENNHGNLLKLLIVRCQNEFMSKQPDEQVLKKQKEVDSAKTEADRDLQMLELEEVKKNAHRRFLGNLKFIGELFNINILTERVMHSCVTKLLADDQEESLEGLCKLLQTVGLKMEKNKSQMDKYFSVMGEIIRKGKTSKRISFLLQDVQDLRKNNWAPRLKRESPKKLEQIWKETVEQKMFFVALLDADIVEDEVFLQWKCSRSFLNLPAKDIERITVFFAELQED